MRRIVWAILLSIVSSVLYADTMRVAGFNIEANDANEQVIAQQIAEFNDIDIWGLAESNERFLSAILQALANKGQHFMAVRGTTGRAQKLQIIYRTRRFDLINSEELHDINPGQRVRSPLVAEFEDKISHKHFLFMVNHLYRSKAALRHLQAEQLNHWAGQLQYPIIGVGDYNFDMDPDNPTAHDRGFDNLTANDQFTWARPTKLLPTQCSRYHSILDFIFVADAAKNWLLSSTILFDRTNYCPDDHTTSDHRPVRATFEL